MVIGKAPLHLKLGFNHVLPGFALLDMERLNLAVTQDGQIILRRKHAAGIGDQRVRAPVFRQGREEDLQDGRQVLMRRRHPGHNLPRIAFDNTDALDPAPSELDEGAHIRDPQVLAVRRARGEVFEAGHIGLRIAGTLPGSWGPMELAMEGQRSPHGARTRGRLLPLLPQ